MSPVADLAAEGYASLFARRYLTWNAAEANAGQGALAQLVGSELDQHAGMRPPQTGEQRVEWSEVVQERELAAGERVYTVAAQTDSAGLVYLTVPVERDASGRLALAGYPAFVGAPNATTALTPRLGREVADRDLATVVERALRNYLAPSMSELAADLTRYARVSLPGLALSLTSTQRISWSPDGRSVLAIIQAQDARGAQYTLGYELDVARLQGRWEVGAIEMDPDA